MKSKLFILQLLAMMAFAGCSNEESINNEPDTSENLNYMAVRLLTPRETVTRATDGGFELGDDAENQASKAMFLLFDEAGNQTQVPQEIPVVFGDKEAAGSNVEKKSNAIVTIAGNTAPTQVLVILNAPSIESLQTKTLSEVKALVADYGAATAGSFIITTSMYKDFAATNIEGKTYRTKAAAEAHPTDIYVERVVAKIRTKAMDGDFKIDDSTITIGGASVTLTPEISNIEIANIAGTSYLFKNLNGSNTWDWEDWNDADHYRSYWAVSPAGLKYKNQSWTAIQDAANTDHTYYVQENTSATKTCVLVTATLKKDGAPYTFVRWAGNYYGKDQFLNHYAQILKNAGYKVTEGSTTRDIATADLLWITPDEHKAYVDAGDLKSYEMTAKLTDAAKQLTFQKDGVASSATDVQATLLQSENCVWMWEGGKCYYFAEIEHFGTGDFAIGVVRNHIYDLTLKTLKGLGTPVFNPDEVIIPEKPEDGLFYLGARINILSWRLVTQNVNFE